MKTRSRRLALVLDGIDCRRSDVRPCAGNAAGRRPGHRRRDRDDRQLQSLCRQHFDGLRASGARSIGCLGIYDFDKGDYVGMLVERWEVDKADNNVWTFHLKRGLKRQNDGMELTADDVVHSVNRINTDPHSKQKQNISPIKEIVALDKYTVKIVTKEPTASLLEYMFDRVIITGEGSLRQARRTRRRSQISLGMGTLQAQGAGDRPAHRAREGQQPSGGQAAEPGHADLHHHARAGAARDRAAQQRDPDRAVHSAASRRARQKAAPTSSCIRASSVEIMFLAMSPKYKPWDNRQAAPGGLLRHRPRPHHQERAEGPGRPARRPDRPGPIRLRRRLRQEESARLPTIRPRRGSWSRRPATTTSRCFSTLRSAATSTTRK